MSSQTQLAEALQNIANQGQGETLHDVTHPADIKDIRVVQLTGDHPSVLKEDRDRRDDGDWITDVVKARLVEVTQLDEYGEKLGDPKLMLHHKYSTPARQSKDISVTAVKPDVIRKLKARFPGTFQEYELKLLRERIELPLVLLDDVPPEVISVLRILGVATIRQFAEYDEAAMLALTDRLKKHRLDSRATHAGDYLNAARRRIGYNPSEPDTSSKAKKQAA